MRRRKFIITAIGASSVASLAGCNSKTYNYAGEITRLDIEEDISEYKDIDSFTTEQQKFLEQILSDTNAKSEYTYESSERLMFDTETIRVRYNNNYYKISYMVSSNYR